MILYLNLDNILYKLHPVIIGERLKILVNFIFLLQITKLPILLNNIKTITRM